jgi:pyruvate formate lyase activating enzyme
MKILGLQKTTLIDYPEKVACTIFLFGCSFRCGFCHNPELVLAPEGREYSKEEILKFLEKRKKYLEAVCFTGGEPLMTLEKDFVKKIKSMGYLIKIDTNGSFPELLKEFIDEKLVDFVAMDIKTTKEDYSKLTGVNLDLNKIERSIKLISNLKDYEFRTTIIEEEHSKEKVKRMIKWVVEIAGKKIKNYSLQGFKKEEKLIDKKYLKVKDTREKYLKELKEEIKDYVENLEIKI